MDLKQIEYIVRIAETGSITKAANQLFITQSALNQQLLKLEKELGVKLFSRHKHDMTPTPAGAVYLKYGRHMLQEKREAYSIINDMSQNNIGELVLTFSRERGIDMLVATYPQFHAKFPGFTLKPYEMFVYDQLNQISQGYVDLGLVTVNPKDKIPELEFEHLRTEPMLLAISRENPLAEDAAPAGTPLEDLPYKDITSCGDQPFVLLHSKSTMRRTINSILKRAAFQPNILFESSSIRALLTMVKTNMACTIVSAGYYKYQDKVAYYRIPGDPVWEMCITYKKGAYLNKAALYYKELMREYFTDKSPLLVRGKRPYAKYRKENK